MSDPSPPVRLLSVDVEDLLVGTAQFYGNPVPPSYRPRVRDDVLRTLECMDATGAKATFFLNAQFVEADPRIAEAIVDEGHVIATHGHDHGDVRRLSPAAFAADLDRSLHILRRFQPRIVGYRAPAYSMPALPEYHAVLRDAGITYVSSGIERCRPGEPATPPGIRVLPGGLRSVPVSVLPLLGGRVRYPIGYGLAARLLPAELYLATVRAWVARRSYFHFYFHPFEVAGLPRVPRGAYPDRWNEIPPKLFRFRSHGRAALFRSVFRTCAFRPIEEFVESSSFPSFAEASA